MKSLLKLAAGLNQQLSKYQMLGNSLNAKITVGNSWVMQVQTKNVTTDHLLLIGLAQAAMWLNVTDLNTLFVDSEILKLPLGVQFNATVKSATDTVELSILMGAGVLGVFAETFNDQPFP